MKLIPFIILAIFGIQMLRKLLETSERLPRWDKFLSKAWIISGAFMGMAFYPPLVFMLGWYPVLIYSFVFITVYLLRNYRPAIFDPSKKVSTDRVYLLRNYRPAQPILLAILPLGIVYIINILLKYIDPEFYQQHLTTVNSAYTVALFWLIGFGIFAISQILKEKKLSIKIQEETLIAEARKAELEMLVTERTNQLMVQNEKLEKALTELKSTQSLLIQSEKMASLGELTAGIAHEIQNPLNFVNNFSEVSKELIGELSEEMDKGNYEEAKLIAVDVVQNLEKINHHGKRADAIVKGMLQHSRTSSGQKEPTDINALCDEYLRLAYHGIKAKDKNFEASFHFEPDNKLPMVHVVPQDIGRVLLNLINNAFQACGNDEFSPDSYRDREMNDKLKPHVEILTKNMEDQIEITVKDNGPGIPDAIKDKIFQPFFTTKPTGQGTGLGLSLSYDIVKAHGGEIKLETEEGQGTSFMILLPTT